MDLIVRDSCYHGLFGKSRHSGGDLRVPHACAFHESFSSSKPPGWRSHVLIFAGISAGYLVRVTLQLTILLLMLLKFARNIKDMLGWTPCLNEHISYLLMPLSKVAVLLWRSHAGILAVFVRKSCIQEHASPFWYGMGILVPLFSWRLWKLCLIAASLYGFRIAAC